MCTGLHIHVVDCLSWTLIHVVKVASVTLLGTRLFFHRYLSRLGVPFSYAVIGNNCSRLIKYCLSVKSNAPLLRLVAFLFVRTLSFKFIYLIHVANHICQATVLNFSLK